MYDYRSRHQSAPLYRVLSQRILVRSGKELTTEPLAHLPFGEVVTVVATSGRRAQIDYPLEGWVSTASEQGLKIMMPCSTMDSMEWLSKIV